MEFAVLGLFCGILILCIVCNVSIMYALLAGFVIFGCYAKKKGFSVKEILHMAGGDRQERSRRSSAIRSIL